MSKTKAILFFLNILFLTGLYGQNETKMDTISYSMGILVAKNMKSQGFENIDSATFMDAFQAVMRGDSLKMTPEEASNVAQTEARRLAEEKNKLVIAVGESFLAENAKKEGVKTLDSGLQYKVLTAGDGAKPLPSDKVKVHYEGKLVDGTIFDSSYKRGEPATFGVSQVIAGWTEALMLMPVGSTWEVYIPYQLGYGARGTQGGPIGPYAALIFKVELLEIVGK